MNKGNKSKIVSFGSLAVLVLMMMAATIIEKVASSDVALSLIYHSPIFILLWVVAVVSGCIWLWKAGLPKRPFVLCLHISFVIILAGALVSHLTSESGFLHLRIQQSSDSFVTEDGETKALPFTITLDDFLVKRYPGGSAAMDYTSEVTVKRIDGSARHTISMNNILKKDGYRIYQSNYDEDEKGSVFYVSHDPYGVTLTYIGYFLLFICLVGFFFCKNSEFRRALSRLSKGSALTFLLIAGLSSTKVSARDSTYSPSMAQMMKEGASLAPKSIPKDVADSLCNIFVSYGGRIAPLQTMARDYVMKVYGEPTVKGYSAEEVFAGWIFYFDTWKSVPVKLKKKEIGTSKEYEKYFLIQSVASQRALKVFPYKWGDSTDKAGSIEWLSPSGDIPYNMDEDEWLFIRKVFALAGEKIYSEDYQGAKEIIAKILKYQNKVAGDILPLPAKVKAERVYNKIARPIVQAMTCVTFGIALFVLMGVYISKRKRLPGWINTFIVVFNVLIAVYLTIILALRWYVSGHVPMAGGFEMMLLIAWISMIFTTAVSKKMPIFQPLGLILTGFALLVAVFGESNPQITPLMPVLSSPLLSVHVATMMISYTLLGLAALASVMGLVVRDSQAKQELSDTSLVILYPGVFLLFIGTFLGAIWANVSWGSYWMWDPKETWALVTCLVYAAAFHKGSLSAFRRPKVLFWFCIISFMCVLITYFGVNFILGGMHSYA